MTFIPARLGVCSLQPFLKQQPNGGPVQSQSFKSRRLGTVATRIWTVQRVGGQRLSVARFSRCEYGEEGGTGSAGERCLNAAGWFPSPCIGLQNGLCTMQDLQDDLDVARKHPVKVKQVILGCGDVLDPQGGTAFAIHVDAAVREPLCHRRTSPGKKSLPKLMFTLQGVEGPAYYSSSNSEERGAGTAAIHRLIFATTRVR